MSRDRGDPRQLGLFGAADDTTTPRSEKQASAGVRPAPVSADDRALAAKIPAGVRLGTSSWSFPGWVEIVYDEKYTESKLAREGLAAYASQPLFRAVGVDRTYYAPVSVDVFREYARVVPEDFRFLVKAHEVVTSQRVFQREAGGRLNGVDSPHFLDAAYASDRVVAPFVEGLGERAGPLVFQFAPLNMRSIGGAEKFADRLHTFLAALPKGLLYAVELRNEKLLSKKYAEALAAVGAAHCYNCHGRMPPAAQQAEVIALDANPALVVRWMLNPKWGYEEARMEYEPFDRLVDEDPVNRGAIAEFCIRAANLGKAAYVIVNNKAEGSSPRSVRKLAEWIADKLP